MPGQWGRYVGLLHHSLNETQVLEGCGRVERTPKHFVVAGREGSSAGARSEECGQGFRGLFWTRNRHLLKLRWCIISQLKIKSIVFYMINLVTV